VRRVKYWAVVDPDRLRRIRGAVMAWFEAEARDLPWRHTRDPYAVLVSEIMLHQTTVQTVLPVYRRFLEAFPTVEALAAAPLGAVKAITDPLGYKVRGRWLKEIAEAVVDRWQGRFPDTLEDLMQLPGVGRYTAGAVLTFAYQRPAGVLDTNVARVLSRLFLVGPEPGGAERLHRLWALAEAVVPPDQPWLFNQGIMELGAVVCRARKPLCLTCPLYALCPSRGTDANRAAEAEPVGVEFWERPRVSRRADRAASAAPV
jgi:A/G-specific adenine glycosylase